MLKEKDHKDNLLFVIGKDGLTMGRKRGSLNHDTYLYGKGGYSMKNIDMQVQGDTLTIKVDLKKEFGPSASGKTIIIATTEGNITVLEHESIKIGINVYKKK